VQRNEFLQPPTLTVEILIFTRWHGWGQGSVLVPAVSGIALVIATEIFVMVGSL
jgi:hypothetical protein